MSFSITTEWLLLEAPNGQDLAGIQRIALNPRVMRYVLLWLENDEQVAKFLQHAIDEAQ